jgi:putative hydroxymethylpyrimidine transport system substrate-binding protein
MYRLGIGSLLLLGLVFTFSLQGAEPERLAVMLDWLPNPNHVPLYVAQAEGFFAEEGLEVELLVPGNPADPAKLAAAGRVDLGITTGLNLIVARDAGLPLLAIGALIQHPLGGLLALKSRISRLEGLRGKRIGYSLEPEEPVLWRAMLGCVGLGPGDYELINVGFNTVSALLSGAVEAIGAFRNYEKILIELEGEETVFFPMEDYCIPDHYQTGLRR